ncbi:MAG: peptidoglycan-binding protein [Myxococcales bacterium]|nr:peptidoglycan-binding protein [Myxococcales bacterium]
MVWGPQNRPGTRPGQPTNDQDTNTSPAQTPQRPQSPGGGALQNPLFSGDHVLERIAGGRGVLKHGAKGPAARAIQEFLIKQGFNLGSAGADGHWGRMTTTAVKAWQAGAGISSDGVVGAGTLGLMDSGKTVTPPPPSQHNSSNTSGPQGSGSQIPKDFEAAWDAHPHNYQDDASQNTASDDLQEEQGWDPHQYSNTCAIRLSVMFNKLGGKFKLTRDKAEAAGLDRRRLPYSRKTGWYYILSAREMWLYMEHWGGKPHDEWPRRGYYSSANKFDEGFKKDAEEKVSGRKGIVAFNKIFGYSGTGHVDVFDGMNLSDADSWYPCKQLKVWYI